MHTVGHAGLASGSYRAIDEPTLHLLWVWRTPWGLRGLVGVLLLLLQITLMLEGQLHRRSALGGVLTNLRVQQSVLRSLPTTFRGEKHPEYTPPPTKAAQQVAPSALSSTHSNNRPCFALIGGNASSATFASCFRALAVSLYPRFWQ